MTGHIIAAGLIPDAVHDWLDELTTEFKTQLLGELIIDVSKQTGQSLTEILHEVKDEIYNAEVFDDKFAA
jgi:hypothetical protein